MPFGGLFRLPAGHRQNGCGNQQHRLRFPLFGCRPNEWMFRVAGNAARYGKAASFLISRKMCRNIMQPENASGIVSKMSTTRRFPTSKLPENIQTVFRQLAGFTPAVPAIWRRRLQTVSSRPAAAVRPALPRRYRARPPGRAAPAQRRCLRAGSIRRCRGR